MRSSDVLKTIFKEHFVLLRRTCSQKSDYLLNSKIMRTKFIERDFHEKELRKTIMQVAKMDRNELLRDRTTENKDPQTLLASTLHHKLNAFPSILKNNFHLISNNP